MLLVSLTVGSRYPVNRVLIRERVQAFLLKQSVDHAQVDISIVGKRKIKELNESALKHEGTTDVLSFPLHEKHQLNDIPLPPGIPPHLGDIIVCYPEAVKMARKYGTLVDEQICFFIEHSLLHLLGYHHE